MIRFRGRAVASLFLFGLFVACKQGKDEPSRGTTPVASASAAIVAPVPSVPVVAERAPELPVGLTVLDVGTEPRMQPRYALKKGKTFRIGLVQKNRIAVKANGESMPPSDVPAIKTILQWDVTETQGDTAKLAFKVISAKVQGNATDPMAAQVNELLAGFKTFRGTQTIDTRGKLIDFAIDDTQETQPQLAQALESVKQSLGQMVAPLPEEPIGIGARWQVISRLEQFGLQLTQKVEYRVVSVQPKGITAAVTIEQSSPPGKVSPPGMPQGMAVDLLALDSKGQGEVQIDYDKFVSQSKLDLTLGMKMRVPEGAGVPAGGQTVEMDLTMGVDIRPER
ncbi:MAG: hypothetical protein QM784_13340 [Polyangiaceae bacterium]